MKYIFLLMLFCFSFSACDMLQKNEAANQTKTKDQISKGNKEDKKQKPTTNKPFVVEDADETNSEAHILNNVIVHERGGLKTGRVYLAFDDGRLVPKTNSVALNTPVSLVLFIKDGWKVQNSGVSLDASIKIITNKGELVLNTPSLFTTSTLVNEADAAQINLRASISKTRSDIDYYIVSYRLWDKQGEGEINGYYKLYIDTGD